MCHVRFFISVFVLYLTLCYFSYFFFRFGRGVWAQGGPPLVVSGCQHHPDAAGRYVRYGAAASGGRPVYQRVGPAGDGPSGAAAGLPAGGEGPFMYYVGESERWYIGPAVRAAQVLLLILLSALLPWHNSMKAIGVPCYCLHWLAHSERWYIWTAVRAVRCKCYC